jgi:hypothetical protein
MVGLRKRVGSVEMELRARGIICEQKEVGGGGEKGFSS